MAAETFGVQPSEVVAACRRLEQHDYARAVLRLSDGAVERIVASLGPERVRRAVDKLTEPPVPFLAAAE